MTDIEIFYGTINIAIRQETQTFNLIPYTFYLIGMRDHRKLRAFTLADEAVLEVYQTTKTFPR
jgi:hypothetical protein